MNDIVGSTKGGGFRARMFTPQVVSVIFKAIGKGQTLKNAAARARITEACLKNWIDDGRIALETWEKGGPLDDGSDDPMPPLAAFYQEYEFHRAGFAQEVIDQLMESAKKTPMAWAAAMTVLERGDPEQWGQTQKQQITSTNSNTITVIWKRVGGDEWAEPNKQIAPPSQIPDLPVVDTHFVDQER